MSELSSSFFDTNKANQSYREAVDSANSISRSRVEQTVAEEEKQRLKDEKANKIKEVATTFGTIPLVEGFKDAFGRVTKKAVNKVTDAVVDKAKSAVSTAIDKATDKVASKIGLHSSQLPENYRSLPKINVNPDELVENLARKQKLAQLKTKSLRANKPFRPTDDINLTDDVGKKALSDAKKMTSSVTHDAATLSHGTESEAALSPKDFFKTTTGDSRGELTRASVGNPSSIFNDQEALQGARDFKEFSSISARTAALKKSLASTELGDDAGIVKAPASMMDKITLKSGDALQPMRDMNPIQRTHAAEQAESERRMAPPSRATEMASKQAETEDRIANQNFKAKEAEKTKGLDEEGLQNGPEVIEGKLPIRGDIPDSLGEITDPGQITAKISDKVNTIGIKSAEDTAEDAGKSVIKSALIRGAEEGGEIAAEGEGSPVADILAGAIGVGTILGGIFGHKSKGPAKLPPPPPPLNPAFARGI